MNLLNTFTTTTRYAGILRWDISRQLSSKPPRERRKLAAGPENQATSTDFVDGGNRDRKSDAILASDAKSDAESASVGERG